jgi:hypothetical protein
MEITTLVKNFTQNIVGRELRLFESVLAINGESGFFERCQNRIRCGQPSDRHESWCPP